MDLLKRYVRAVISERVRPGKFNWDVFKSLDWRDMYMYIDDRLTRLGKGSSRIVYLYNSSYVIKLAYNDKGTAQNVEELNVFNDYDVKPIVAKIADYDPEARWSLSEIVRPIRSEDEFFSLLGIHKGVNSAKGMTFDWGSTVREFIDTVHARPDRESLNRALVTLPKAAQIKVAAIWHAIHDMKLETGDLHELEHWGKSAEGNIALLDYGFSTEVYNNHYKEA